MADPIQELLETIRQHEEDGLADLLHRWPSVKKLLPAVLDLISQPQSLAFHCRRAWRNHVQRDGKRILASMSFPAKLKDYLMLADLDHMDFSSSQKLSLFW